MPRPNPVQLELVPAAGRAGGSLVLGIGRATETDIALPITPVITKAARAESDVAVSMAEAWQILFVPLGTAGMAFAVAAEYTDDATTPVIAAVAVAIVTAFSMRDARFFRVVKRAATWLTPRD